MEEERVRSFILLLIGVVLGALFFQMRRYVSSRLGRVALGAAACVAAAVAGLAASDVVGLTDPAWHAILAIVAAVSVWLAALVV